MKVSIYGIFDQKAGAFLQPFFSPNNQLAFRNVEKACRNPQSPFVDFPADFTLFRLAEFDDETGIFEPLKVHENLGNFLQFQVADDSRPDVSATPDRV